MAADPDVIRRVLEAIPQQRPFRFIDEITDIDGERITGTYRFRPDEHFYAGHFPGNPITPGVILIEAMAQVFVALGIYQFLLRDGTADMSGVTTLFSMVEGVEFLKPVYPGERVTITGEKIYFRRGSMKVSVSMVKEGGEAVCHGNIMGVIAAGKH